MRELCERAVAVQRSVSSSRQARNRDLQGKIGLLKACDESKHLKRIMRARSYHLEGYQFKTKSIGRLYSWGPGGVVSSRAQAGGPTKVERAVGEGPRLLVSC